MLAIFSPCPGIKVRIRLAVESDLNEIMRLEQSGFPYNAENSDTFVTRMRTFSVGFLVMEEDCSDDLKRSVPATSTNSVHLIGYLCSEIWNSTQNWSPNNFLMNHNASALHTIDGNELYISSMTVDSNWRGKGLARMLFRTAIDEIFRQHPKLTSIILIVNEIWTYAKNIYVSEGFCSVGQIDGFFSAGGQAQTAIVMRRTGRVLTNAA
jgi:ribosomal protein S18 acetylase RimI-like enzyme